MKFDLIIEQDQITPAVSYLLTRWSDLAPLQYQVQGVFREGLQETYDTQGHGQWAPRKKAYPHPMLRRTGRMYRSQMQAVSRMHYARSGNEHLFDASEIYNASSIYKHHHHGTRKTAARPTLQLTEKRQKELEQIVAKYVCS